MKVIIDIPDEMYRKIKNDEYTDVERYCGMLSIQNGTPLDDIKSEIQDIYVGYRHPYEIMADVLAVLDKHIEERSEDGNNMV